MDGGRALRTPTPVLTSAPARQQTRRARVGVGSAASPDAIDSAVGSCSAHAVEASSPRRRVDVPDAFWGTPVVSIALFASRAASLRSGRGPRESGGLCSRATFG
jgi:hypothetical protein